MRVLRSRTVQEWEQAGCPTRGKRPGEGQIIGRLKRAEFELGPELTKYGGFPTDYFEGDIDGCGFPAGQSVSLVREILPAGEIVRRIVNEARDVIEKAVRETKYWIGLLIFVFLCAAAFRRRRRRKASQRSKKDRFYFREKTTTLTLPRFGGQISAWGLGNCAFGQGVPCHHDAD